MSESASDTHPEIEALQIELLRRVSPARKMEMLAQLNAAARTLALEGLRTRFPGMTETELKHKLAELLLGRDMARKIFGEADHGG